MSGGPDAPDAWADDRRPAVERFRLEIQEPSGLVSMIRSAVVLVVGALTLGSGPANPGGRRVVVIDLETGRPVGQVAERIGDDVDNDVGMIHQDLRRLDAAAFAERWLS